ncbi:MAG: alpha-amylase family glycosyl hydrolase [Lysobacterales bacterium]|jgi:glycosidase
MSIRFRLTALVGLAALVMAAPALPADRDFMPEPYVRIEHPEWSRDAVLYQINTRQFTPEGTFDAATRQLPRLKKLGVDILWLMPVQPIGEKHRKGGLGSPYSIRDYRGVNSELGDLDSLKRFVASAHALGMHVILDWVANHTAWDNPLVEQHPEWYKRNAEGKFHSPAWTDWSDVIQLDYSHPGLREYMASAMEWWVRDVGMDGFRCDVAGFVPVDFWDQLRAHLDSIRPVFMLAEWETRDLHARAFDATYAWSWYDSVHRIAAGTADASALEIYHYTDEKAWPEDGMRMLFTSNHDKNAWEDTQFEAFNDALEAAIVLSFTSKGIPLIYNGQEAGNPKRLAFFERDPIVWRDHPLNELFHRLIALKKANSALWNGAWGAEMTQVANSAPKQVLSFVRANERNRVFGVFNLSPKPVEVTFSTALYQGEYSEFSSGEHATLDADASLALPPWGYRIFVH